MFLDSDNETTVPNLVNPTVKKYKKAFGKLVKALRDDPGRKWTQVNLSDATQGRIPIRTITDVENGNKAVLDHSTVSCLADAFGLEGLLREEFFGTAGLVVDRVSIGRIGPVEEKIIRRFYKKTSFPAYVYDPLFNLHSVNAYLFSIFGNMLGNFEDEILAGPNILRLWFDPQYREKSGMLDDREWRAFVESNVYLFRNSSQKYIHTPEYSNLIKDLRQRSGFREVWSMVTKTTFTPDVPAPAVFHRVNGERLEFMVACAICSKLPTTDMTMMIYIPTDEYTQQKCSEVSRDTSQTIIRFDSTQPQGLSVVPL